MCLSPGRLEMEINAKICFSGKSSFLIRRWKAQDSFVLPFLRGCGGFSFLASSFLLERNLFISHPLHTPAPKLKYLSKIILLSAQS